MSARCWLVLVLLLAGRAPVVCAGDWPQILGPNRDGIAHGERLADSWPEEGPATVWERSVGSGFSGVAVAGGRTILFHRLGNQETVEAMDARTGDVQWTRSFPTAYRPSIVDDNGPRAVPVIHDGSVYVFGVEGGLRALDLKSGAVRWSRETHKDFSVTEGYFGAGTTPIVAGDRLLVNIGATRDQAGIVAFALADGRTLWKATVEGASYSSPILAPLGGEPGVIFITRLNALLIDPRDGQVGFRVPFGQRGPTVNGANPTLLGDRLFLTASYGTGAKLVDVRRNEANVVWSRDEVLSSQYTTCVEHEGALFGIHGRQDLGVAALTCIDPVKGDVLWRESNFGYATLIRAGDRLLIQKTEGELMLAAADRAAFRPLARAEVFFDTVRALPALADGLYYARDTGTLKCLDLRPAR